MDFEHARLNQCEQTIDIVDYEHRLVFSGLDPSHRFIEARPLVLGVKAGLFDSAGTANKAQRPANEMRQDPIGRLRIKIRKPLLGDAVRRPEQSFGARQRFAPSGRLATG